MIVGVVIAALNFASHILNHSEIYFFIIYMALSI